MEVTDDGWDVYRLHLPCRYRFDTTEYVQDNMFKAESNRILGEEVENDAPTPKKRKLHLIHLPNEMALSNYKTMALSFNTHDFSPFFTMKSDNTPGTVFGIGRDLGVPIKDWMKAHGRTIWEYDSAGNYKRPGVDWRLIGRLLGTGVYANHIEGKFIGNLLNSTYIDEANGKITFAKGPRTNPLTDVAGIQSDLLELISLVGWVQKEIPVHHPNPPMDDILIFHDMFPQTSLPSSLQELKEFSYFLCHNFLYFEDSHRFSFADAFRRMRTTIHDFESHVQFTGRNSISTNWDLDLPQIGPFIKCYKFKTAMHKSAVGQIHFHRSCLHHYNDHVDSPIDKLDKKGLDQELIKVLPLAIPKGFSAFFKSGGILQADKIIELKRDINYLEQYKLQT